MIDNQPQISSGLPFHRGLLHPRYLLTWLGLVIAFFVSLWPVVVRHKLGDIIGGYLFRYKQKRRVIVEANLKQVFPNITQTVLAAKVHEHLCWYGRAMVDYSVFFFGRKKYLEKKVSIINEALLQTARDSSEPVVLLLAHSVMLEFAAVALSMKGYSSFGSYKTSKNPVIDWMIARSRCRFVDFVVSRQQGLRPLIRGIQSGSIMIFLPDEDLGLENGVYAPFFGRNKATLSTPARLVKMGKAKAIMGFTMYDEISQQYQLQLAALPESYPINNAVTDATSMNEALELLIAESPNQYMWLMKWYRTRLLGSDSFY